jgi:hypothetical protein
MQHSSESQIEQHIHVCSTQNICSLFINTRKVKHAITYSQNLLNSRIQIYLHSSYKVISVVCISVTISKWIKERVCKRFDLNLDFRVAY